MNITHRAKQEADGPGFGRTESEGTRRAWKSVAQTMPVRFPRLRLALFDRVERNPWWVPVARDRPRSNLSARVIALAGILPLDRKKFSGRRVSQLITRRSWNSGCCETTVSESTVTVIDSSAILITSLYSFIERVCWSALSSVSQSETIIRLENSLQYFKDVRLHL